jgi:signal transduction histidine kinase
VRAHGGELTVDNGAAGGAAVTIILPASPSAARATDVNGTVPRGA